MTARKNLGTMTSELLDLARNAWRAQDDIGLFHGPGECRPIVAAGFTARAQRIVESYGFTSVDDAIEVIAARTSNKWVYESGLSDLGRANAATS